MRLLPLLLWVLLPLPSLAGFGEPVDLRALQKSLYGPPCACNGGTQTIIPTTYTQAADCSNKTAYLEAPRSPTGGYGKLRWVCVSKPKVIPPGPSGPGPCPPDCVNLETLHSTCYTSVQTCMDSTGQLRLTVIQQRARSGTAGGDWDHSPKSIGGHSNKYAQASCPGSSVGKPVCWLPRAPLHISDGGGVSDQLREEEIKQRVENLTGALSIP